MRQQCGMDAGCLVSGGLSVVSRGRGRYAETDDVKRSRGGGARVIHKFRIRTVDLLGLGSKHRSKCNDRQNEKKGMLDMITAGCWEARIAREFDDDSKSSSLYLRFPDSLGKRSNQSIEQSITLPPAATASSP